MTTVTPQQVQPPDVAGFGDGFRGRYLSLTTFKRDGTPVATPLWFVSDGHRLLALTDLHSAKVRRIRHTPDVLVAACTASGRLRGEPRAARAQVLTATGDLDRVQARLKARYRLSYRLVMAAYRIGRRLRGRPAVADGAALVITATGPSPATSPAEPRSASGTGAGGGTMRGGA